MQVVETFGRYVEQWSGPRPRRAQGLLRLGWEAQNFKNRHLPDKRLLPADRYLATVMMDAMLKPLQAPASSAIVSVFTPCELLQEAGLNPYNVEGFSCYLSGSCAERGFLQQAENAGISETLCSYHKTFLGAADKGVLPRPACIVYTNLTCDANLLTFRRLAEMYHVPVFAIDVPMQQSEENVAYVADQLRQLAEFLHTVTGRALDEEALRARLRRSRRTLEKFRECQRARADRYVPTDLVTPLYSGMTNNILLGSEAVEAYADRLLADIKAAGPARGKRIYWMHTIPFWSEAVRHALAFREEAQIVGCELSQVCEPEFDPESPFEAMAWRMVYHSLNGSALRRIEAGIRRARECGADGVVWFDHWGCKHTLGSAQLAKKKFEEAGLPLLILDGDGCDRSHGGEGQTATRLEAFLEMLGEGGQPA